MLTLESIRMLTKEVNVFKALSDETRLRIMNLLAHEDEMCVSDLAKLLGVHQSKVSRHLTVLRNAGLVEPRRDGVRMLYRFVEPTQPLHTHLLDLFRDGLRDNAQLEADLSALSPIKRPETVRWAQKATKGAGSSAA